MIDLPQLVADAEGRGPAWTWAGEDLNVNLVVWPGGSGVDEHVNSEVEVMLVGIDGEGTVTIDGRSEPLRAGGLLVIPRGARRAIRASSARFAYLSCHRRRAGLQPLNPGRRAMD